MNPKRFTQRLRDLPLFVGAVAKRMRKEAGLSQHTLAAKIGSHHPIISRLEQGKHHQSLPILARWAAACGCPLTRFTVAIDHYLGLLPERRKPK